MTTELLNEPELEFGGGFRHVDIRFGIMSYGPFDVASEMAPKRIRIGIVGTEKTVERFLSWLEQCKSGLVAKHVTSLTSFLAFLDSEKTLAYEQR